MDKRSEFWVEVVCDECATSGPGQFVRGGSIPVRGLANEAERRGWRRRTGGTFECPSCNRDTMNRLKAIMAGTLSPITGGSEG